MVDFLVIGLRAGYIYNNIFHLIRDGKVSLGYGRDNMYFENIDTGVISRWFSNISDYHPSPLELKRKYIEGDYRVFDNLDYINIDRIEDIPGDYFDIMAVPVSFIDKYNSEQFEIVGLFCDNRNGDHLINGDPRYIDEGHKSYVGPVMDGKAMYDRLLIKRKIS